MNKILEQGTYPEDKPSEEAEGCVYWDGFSWEACSCDNLADGDMWMVLSHPKKELESMTDEELYQEVKAKGIRITMNPLEETIREALIKALK